MVRLEEKIVAKEIANIKTFFSKFFLLKHMVIYYVKRKF